MRKIRSICILALVLSIIFSGCGIFKKKCDCPPVGNTPVKEAGRKA